MNNNNVKIKKYYVIANFKMNKTYNETIEYFKNYFKLFNDLLLSNNNLILVLLLFIIIVIIICNIRLISTFLITINRAIPVVNTICQIYNITCNIRY